MQLSWPQAGVPAQDRFLHRYSDLDPTLGERDWAGGQFTSDNYTGLDLGSTNNAQMDIGVAILAAAPGTVIEVQDGNYDRSHGPAENITPGGPSNYVIIDHGDGWQTVYDHLRRDSIQVQVGELVQRGDRLGLEGSSGESTRSHLQFGVRHNLLQVETFLDPNVYWQNPPPYSGSTRYLIDSGITNYNMLSPGESFR